MMNRVVKSLVFIVVFVPAAGLAGDDSSAFNQEQALLDLKKQIAGRENEPAENVFKNIKVLRGVPAARVLRIMELGYGKSLGVACTHCHTTAGWESEAKPQKQVARQMAAMVATINNDLLKQIKDLRGENAVVNCTTCHRGETTPALNLPEGEHKK